MFHNDEIAGLEAAVREAVTRDKDVLAALREQARALRANVRVVHPRTATTVSLVASDGGNHSFPLDPFLVQVVRVVDSYGLPLCFDVVTPSTDIDQLSSRQFDAQHRPRTALGRLMADLECTHLSELSPAIPKQLNKDPHPEDISSGWVVTYRDLCEWATLYERICYRDFPTDTVLVRDGLLRAKYFAGTKFTKLGELIDQRISDLKRSRRRVFLAGIAKHSKILDRYGLAFCVEDTFPDGNACYLEVPRDLEKTVYRWSEYARGRLDPGDGGGEEPRFVNGKMFLTRFGKRNTDPIWPVDIFESQATNAQEILGFLLQDAINGFPVPFYPRSLQLAHEWAEIAGFDADIIADAMRLAVGGFDTAVRNAIENQSLGDSDVSSRRYR